MIRGELRISLIYTLLTFHISHARSSHLRWGLLKGRNLKNTVHDDGDALPQRGGSKDAPSVTTSLAEDLYH